MPLPIAEAFVRLRADTKKYKAKINSAKRTTASFGKSATKSLKMVTLGIAAIGVAAGIAAVAIGVKLTRVVIRLGTAALQSFAQLQQGMAEVSTMIKTNLGPSMAALTAGVRELSLVSPKSTENLSAALYDLLSASVPVSQSLKALKESTKAAVAGLSSVKTAANLATGTANALRIPFAKMDKIFDTAFATVREGKVTFEELAASLGQVLPSATKIKSPIEELYGSIAFLTKNAFSADMASVSLARAFDALGSKAGLLEGLGVRVFGETGEYVGLLNVIKDISKQISGLSDLAKVNFFEEMGFDIRAARAIIVMSENIEGLEATLNNVADSAGAMGIAYSRMAGTLVNKWKILQNSFTELKRTIVEGLAGIADTFLDSLTGIVQKLAIVLKSYKDHTHAAGLMFERIGKIAVDTTIEMFKALIRIIAEAAKVMWVPLKFHFVGMLRDISDAAEITMIKIVNKFKVRGKEIAELQINTVKTDREMWDMLRRQQEKAEFSLAFDKATAKIRTSFSKLISSLMGGMGGINKILDQYIAKMEKSGVATLELEEDVVSMGDAVAGLEVVSQFSAWGFIIGKNIEAVKKLGKGIKSAAKEGKQEWNLLLEAMDMHKMILEANRATEALKKVFDGLREKVETVFSEITRAMEDLFVGLANKEGKKAWEQFWEELKQIAIKQLAQIAAFAILAPIKNAVMKEVGAGEKASTGDTVKSAAIQAGIMLGIKAIGASLGIPLAKGGIVRKPTLALIGESGPEAVVPLGKPQKQMAGGLVIQNLQIDIHEQDLANLDEERLRKTITQKFLPILRTAAADGIGG